MHPLTFVIAAVFSLPAFADSTPQWYSQVYPSNINSQITLKDSANNNVVTVTNPTSATVQLNTNINTQPPVIVQPQAGYTRWSLYYKDRANGLP